MTEHPRKKRLGVRLALAAAAAAATLLVMELGFRIYNYGWASLSPRQMRSVHALGRSGMVRASGLVRPDYELEPNLREHFKMRPFETNSFGMRDREYTLEKPADTFRIAMVGDSWTMGSGVAIENVWHSLLEEQLNARGGTVSYECLNFGVGGYGMWDYVGVLGERVQAFEPDLILLCLSSNDKVPQPRVLPEFVEKPASDAFLSLSLLEHVRMLLATDPDEDDGASGPLAASPQEPARFPPRPGDPLPPEMMAYLRETFDEVGRLRRALGRPIWVVNLAGAYSSEHRSKTFAAYELVSAENELPYWDVGHAFADRSPSEFWIFRNDHHPNAEGHGMLAGSILQFLDGGGVLPD